MPVWPKTLYAFRASLQTARMRARLKRDRAEAEQAETLPPLLRRLAATQVWREAGVETGMNYDAFRARVRAHTYEQLAPAVQRMMAGEPNVLWPGRCPFFATTAGTTADAPKYIPVPEEMLVHVQEAALDALLYYTARTGHAGVFRGRHLLVGGTTALLPVSTAPAPPAHAGNLGGIALLHLPSWAEKHLREPAETVGRMPDWDAKLEAIVTDSSGRDVSLLAGIPPWTLALADLLRKRFSGGGETLKNLQELWPNLECYVHGGVPVAPYQTELRAALGPDVNFHEVYAAAEGFIAVQDQDASAGLRVISNRGVFFEFVPMTEIDAAGLERAAQKAVPLAGVKTGVDYAVLLTTPAGFARYALGDVVRFISTRPPRLVCLGQVKLDLSAFGERVTEKEITDALVALCARHDWTLVNFHVAPLFATSLTGQNRGRHEWWIELKPGTTITPIGPQMAAALDAELQRLNPLYAAKRRAGAVESPFVRLVMPGVFEHWMRFHRRWGGQNKLPRARSDRSIADELAQITNFAPH